MPAGRAGITAPPTAIPARAAGDQVTMRIVQKSDDSPRVVR